MPSWLLPLLMIAPQLLGGLFGKKQEEPTQTSTTTQEGFRGWQSPAYAMMEPYMLKLLMGNQDVFSSFGMPTGTSRNVDMSGMFKDIFDLLDTEWPAIMKGYKNPATTNYAAPARSSNVTVTRG